MFLAVYPFSLSVIPRTMWQIVFVGGVYNTGCYLVKLKAPWHRMIIFLPMVVVIMSARKCNFFLVFHQRRIYGTFT